MKLIPPSFWIALIALLTLSGASRALAADVTQYAVLKGQMFVQTNAVSPVIDEEAGFVFHVFVDSDSDWDEDDTLTSVTLRLPNSSLVSIPDDDGFEFGDGFPSLSALDTAYPDGTYALITEGVNDGLRTNSLTLTGSDYPPTPRFSNFTAAQAVDPAADFVLSWDPISGGSTNDFLMVNIMGCGDDGDDILETPGPGEPGALDGLSTSVTIPARKLRPGQTYQVELLIGRFGEFDEESYPGALGFAGYFKLVQMPLVTTGEQTGCSQGGFQLVFNFQHGSFGAGTNGMIQFPQPLSYYFVNFSIRDSDYPETVTFSGPLGSGLDNTTNAHSGSSFDSAYYGSPQVDMPPFPPGGVYTIGYKDTELKWNLLDPDAANQQVIIVPSVVVDASNVLQQINWTYKDINGNSIPPQPFMTGIGLSVEAVGGRYDVFSGNDQGITPDQTNHILTSTVIWTNVSMVFMHFTDPANNSYWSYWSRSSIPPEITTTNLPSGTVGTPYSFLLHANGGTGQFTWDIESGTLPDGLSLTGAIGEIVGTPTQAGTNEVVIRVTDTAFSSATNSFSIVIHPGAVPPSFSSANRLLNGDFEMLLSGESGKTYRIEGSTNLIQWSELLTSGAHPIDGTLYFRDTTAAGLERRYYRAMLVP
ncbi:MAG: putative Ig domain-containing protein [Verrucomicrobia bacterium]|nr:putative Ig domain-containing protein [Verrucomicrobiota bacterium]